MKTLLPALLPLFLFAEAQAVVLFNVLPEPVRILNRETPTIRLDPIDLDGNGTVDFTFGSSVVSASVRSERANRIIISPSPPPNLGGGVAALESGFSIFGGVGSEQFRWTSTDLGDGFVSPGEIRFSQIITVLNTGSSTEFQGRAAIGLEFEAEDGIHYGYFDVSLIDRRTPGIDLYGWAWETEPGVPITAVAIPEPQTSVLLGLVLLLVLGSRIRRQQGTIGSP